MCAEYRRANSSEVKNRADKGSKISLSIRTMMKSQLDDLRTTNFWRAVLAELIGTMFLVLYVIGALMHDIEKEKITHVHVSLVGGFFIAIVIMTFLHVSGGHVNPAISIGFVLTRHISVVRFLMYVAAQCLGAVIGAYILKVLVPPVMVPSMGVIKPHPEMTPLQAVVMEFLITYFLLLAAFAILDPGRKCVSGSVPLGIGIIVVINILFAGNKCGGCMNPALNFGPAVVVWDWEYQWVYWVGDMLGASCGTLTYDKLFSVSAQKCHMKSCCLSIRSSAQDDDSFESKEPPTEEKTCTPLIQHSKMFEEVTTM